MVACFTRIIKLLFACLILGVAFCKEALAQVSINPFTSEYLQNFNGLPSSGTGTWVSGTSYFSGWYLNRTITTTTSLLTGTGSNNAGGLYSYGPSGSTDRALGAISSATPTVGEFAWGLLIQNNTGKNITALHINFTGEQWRSSSSSAPQQTTTFWYAINSDAAVFNLSPKSDAGWTSVKELDFSGPVFKASPGPLDGNAPANRKFLSAVIPLTLPAGHYVMLRWKDLNDLYDDHGLAIDDFSMTWSTESVGEPTVLPVELMSFKASVQHNNVKLNWATASEKDNDHFIVERSHNGKEFAGIATISGKGTITTRTNYSFTDSEPVPGLLYYRLKQVDLDGTFAYSKIVSAKVQGLGRAILYPTITSDLLYLNVPENTDYAATIMNTAGKEVYNIKLTPGSRQHVLGVTQLMAGAYNLLVINKAGQRTVLRFVKQ